MIPCTTHKQKHAYTITYDIYMLKNCTYNIGDATSNVKCVKTFMQAVQHMLHHVAMLPVF